MLAGFKFTAAVVIIILVIFLATVGTDDPSAVAGGVDTIKIPAIFTPITVVSFHMLAKFFPARRTPVLPAAAIVGCNMRLMLAILRSAMIARLNYAAALMRMVNRTIGNVAMFAIPECTIAAARRSPAAGAFAAGVMYIMFRTVDFSAFGTNGLVAIFRYIRAIINVEHSI
ncbi:MAG: hypothetical protein IJS14_03835 [Lentisphaeria bacterium]|nr:hypothetical protein [Lentisphaeria bacterium]